MPEIRNVEAVKVLCLEQTGRIQGMRGLFQELTDFFESRGVPYNPERMGLIYDDGADPERRHFAAAVELRGDINGDGECIVVLLPGGRIACETHHGPYAQVGETYGRLRAWVEEQGYRIVGPAREYYVEGFAPASDDATVTEIHLPVEPAGA